MRTRRSQSSSNPVSGETTGPFFAETTKGTHRTVLLHEAVDALRIVEGDTVVDMTLGGGGHTSEILKALNGTGTFIGFDADHAAIERVRPIVESRQGTSILIHANFRHVARELHAHGVNEISSALFDLGWSGFQLTAGRGFSFLADEPLSMAYDENSALTARTIVNQWEEGSIADVIFGWGEDRFARRIAHAIVEARGRKHIETSRELGEIIKQAVPGSARFGKTHPATKSFQALRIAVNDELGALNEALRATWSVLKPGGRIAIISFHSIEDRIVKHRFQEWERSGEGIRITRKPVIPSDEELSENPRARSAKLRVIEKVSEEL